MKIAVIGAGIGGLTTALCLENLGISVNLYEQAEVMKDIGAGIILAHNAMQVYDHLGLKNDITQSGNALSSTKITTPELNAISTIDIAQFDAQYGVSSIAIHRATLMQLLTSRLKSSDIQTNKKLISIEPGQKATLTFDDASTESFDIVLAADGLNSVTRQLLFPDSVTRSANQMCWRGISDFELPVELISELNESWGKDSRFGFVCIGPDKVYWYALTAADSADARLPEVFHEDYAPIISNIISNTRESQIHLDQIRDLKPISNWHLNNVCLLGDAAHATTPNMGQGACQAIEDAHILSQCIQKYPLAEAFQHYQRLRMSKAHKIVKTSWVLGKLAHLKNPVLSTLRNFMLRHTPAKLNTKQLASILTLAKVD